MTDDSAALASQTSEAAEDWVDRLTEVILEDRVDRHATEAEARRRAEAYAAWLPRLSAPHDPNRCEVEEEIHHWPGELGFHTGQATVLVGSQGRGKTSCGCYLIEHILEHRRDCDVYTNIPFPWTSTSFRDFGIPSPPRLYPIASMRQMLRGISNSVKARRRPVIAVDEMDQAITSHSWADDPDESWMKFLYVERHLRVRGPMMMFHVYEHVPLALRRSGDLRGSYFRIVIRNGKRMLARVEDQSQWWIVGDTVLPFLTLGLRGFSIDVDMADLERSLDGDVYTVAGQVLAYLDALDRKEEEERDNDPSAARAAHSKSVVEVHLSAAERNRALTSRDEEIIRAYLADPALTRRAAEARFHASPNHLVKLKAVAEARRRATGV